MYSVRVIQVSMLGNTLRSSGSWTDTFQVLIPYETHIFSRKLMLYNFVDISARVQSIALIMPQFSCLRSSSGLEINKNSHTGGSNCDFLYGGKTINCWNTNSLPTMRSFVGISVVTNAMTAVLSIRNEQVLSLAWAFVYSSKSGVCHISNSVQSCCGKLTSLTGLTGELVSTAAIRIHQM